MATPLCSCRTLDECSARTMSSSRHIHSLCRIRLSHRSMANCSTTSATAGGCHSIFSEARELLSNNDNFWIIKAMLAVPDYWESRSLRPSHTRALVGRYIRLCLFLLEESGLLQAFPESEKESYQGVGQCSSVPPGERMLCSWSIGIQRDRR